MSVMKMSFINIIGSLNNFDDFVKNNVIDSNIHLENALNVLGKTKGLYPFLEENPYESSLKKAKKTVELIEDYTYIEKKENELDISNIDNYLEQLNVQIDTYIERKQQVEETIANNNRIIMHLKHIETFDIELDSLFHLEYINFRFGKLPKDSFKKLQTYLKDLQVFVFPAQYDKDMVWILYFMPMVLEEKIDSIFASLYFERVRIPDKAYETPLESIALITKENEQLKAEIDNIYNELISKLNEEKETIIGYYSYLKLMNNVFNIRRYSAHTQQSFYLAGWIPKNDVEYFVEKINSIEGISYVLEEAEMVKRSRPPTQLQNLKILKPFESIVKIYGLPAYNELDPTFFIAFTYALLFGMMFGDVGQGAILFLGGLYMKYKGKKDMGGVLMPVGLSSTIFGFLYGSVFGYEHAIPTLWLKPIEKENITYFMLISIAIGVLLITIAMIFNLINGIYSKNIGKILFNKNGIAGFVLYWGTLFLIIYYVINRRMLVSAYIAGVVFIIALLCIALKEPLENIIHKNSQIFPSEKGSFIAEAGFEIFETILGFVSNTISFVRVSAFALNHAGLFMAIFIIANMFSTAGNIIAVILGNILIIGLEGLIVGIQNLRLVYYELFSRFFIGEGRPFRPINALEDIN